MCDSYMVFDTPEGWGLRAPKLVFVSFVTPASQQIFCFQASQQGPFARSFISTISSRSQKGFTVKEGGASWSI